MYVTDEAGVTDVLSATRAWSVTSIRFMHYNRCVDFIRRYIGCVDYVRYINAIGYIDYIGYIIFHGLHPHSVAFISSVTSVSSDIGYTRYIR